MNKIISDLSKFNLKEDEFDAISFFKTMDGWRFLIVKYTKTPEDYDKTEMGYKYYMFHTDERLNNVPIVEEAILGDPLRIINNYTKANCEGIFAKKCAVSKDILEKFILKDSDRKFEDFKTIVKQEGKEV